MQMDKELIDDFVKEIKLINNDLKKIVASQKDAKKLDLKEFEKFGQFVDRIYGTATTLGFAEVGKYMLAMKEACYMSSQCTRETPQKKVLRMMIECVENMDKICQSIYNAEELKNLNRLFIVEVSKVERLSKTDFQNIKRKSTA